MERRRKRREKEEKKKRKRRERREEYEWYEEETEGCGNKQPKEQKMVDTEIEVWDEEGEGE